MKPKLHLIAGVLILGTLVCVGRGQDAASLRIPQLRETPEQRESRMQWFRDAKFGMFVHWGQPPSAARKLVGAWRGASRADNST
jgi:alpha-L-fucosidase